MSKTQQHDVARLEALMDKLAAPQPGGEQSIEASIEQHASAIVDAASADPDLQAAIGSAVPPAGGAQSSGVPLGDIWGAVVKAAPAKPALKKPETAESAPVQPSQPAQPTVEAVSEGSEPLPAAELQAQVGAIQAAITTPREAKPVITDVRVIPGEAPAKSLRVVMEDRYSIRYRPSADYRLFALEVSGIDAGQLTIDAEGKAKQDASGGRSAQAFRRPARGTVVVGPVWSHGMTYTLDAMRTLAADEALTSSAVQRDSAGRVTSPFEVFNDPVRAPMCKSCGRNPEEGAEVACIKHNIMVAPANRMQALAQHFNLSSREDVQSFCYSCEEHNMGWQRQFQDPGNIPTPVLERMVAVYNRGKLLPEWAVLPRLFARVAWDGKTRPGGYVPEATDVRHAAIEKRYDEMAVARFGATWASHRTTIIPADLAAAAGVPVIRYVLERTFDLDASTPGKLVPGVAIGFVHKNVARQLTGVPGIGYHIRLQGGYRRSQMAGVVA